MARSVSAEFMEAISNGMSWMDDTKALALVQMLHKLPEARRPVAQELLKVMQHPAARNTSAVLMQKKKLERKKVSQLNNKVYMGKFMKQSQRTKEVHTYIRRKMRTKPSEEWLMLHGEDSNLAGAYFDNDDAAVVFHKLLALKSHWALAQGHKITFDDFVKRMTTRLGPDDTVDDIMSIFDLFDHDSTGTISFENLQNVARIIGTNDDAKDIQDMLTILDTDGDGELDPIDFYVCCVSGMRVRNDKEKRRREALADQQTREMQALDRASSMQGRRR
jgi:hypothetical protein